MNEDRIKQIIREVLEERKNAVKTAAFLFLFQ